MANTGTLTVTPSAAVSRTVPGQRTQSLVGSLPTLQFVRTATDTADVKANRYTFTVTADGTIVLALNTGALTGTATYTTVKNIPRFFSTSTPAPTVVSQVILTLEKGDESDDVDLLAVLNDGADDQDIIPLGSPAGNTYPCFVIKGGYMNSAEDGYATLTLTIAGLTAGNATINLVLIG